MNNETPYLTQLCNLLEDLESRGYTTLTIPSPESRRIRKLVEAIVEQSGLSRNELSIILFCRKHRVNLMMTKK